MKVPYYKPRNESEDFSEQLATMNSETNVTKLNRAGQSQ